MNQSLKPLWHNLVKTGKDSMNGKHVNRNSGEIGLLLKSESVSKISHEARNLETF